MAPRLIIIGAGISGLTAGVYAAKSGFRTLILEKCATPGGVSTCWKRKGYTFEGGVHWLTGSGDHLPLNKVWREAGALKENNPVYNKDPFFVLETPSGELPLWRDPGKMYRTLLEHAPEDRRPIRQLKRHIRWFKYFQSPVTDIRGLERSVPKPWSPMEFIRMFPALLLAPWLWAISVGDYVSRFRNKDLRDLLGSIMNPGHNALSFIVTVSSFCYGDSGYPSGGSLLMARNMEETFRSCGGEIRYNTPVERIVEEDGKVKGAMAGGELIESDAVLVSVDARNAIDRLFSPTLTDRWAMKMRRHLRTGQCMFIGFGVRADLRNLPKSMVFPLGKPFEAGGLTFNTLNIHNYAMDGYAPEGCTTLTVLLLGDSYSYWKAAREDGSYYDRKQDVVQRLCRMVEELIPSVKGLIEVTDMATPLTVERFCGNHQGGYMTLWQKHTLTPVAPLRYRKGIYFAGLRTSLSGGLPIAVSTGRKVVQYVCRDFGLPFGGY